MKALQSRVFQDTYCYRSVCSYVWQSKVGLTHQGDPLILVLAAWFSSLINSISHLFLLIMAFSDSLQTRRPSYAYEYVFSTPKVDLASIFISVNLDQAYSLSLM